ERSRPRTQCELRRGVALQPRRSEQPVLEHPRARTAALELHLLREAAQTAELLRDARVRHEGPQPTTPLQQVLVDELLRRLPDGRAADSVRVAELLLRRQGHSWAELARRDPALQVLLDLVVERYPARLVDPVAPLALRCAHHAVARSRARGPSSRTS